MTEEIFVFCGSFSNQFDIVSEKHFSCDTVGRELWLAILCSLLCSETDWNIRIGSKVMCLFYLKLRSDILMFRS